VNIVIAAWHLRDFNVGMGRYCRGLIEALGRVDRVNHYEILMPDDTVRFPVRPNMRYRRIRVPIFKRRFWEQVAPWLAGPHDLLHFPHDSCVAWKRAKFVATVHDVKPMLFPALAQRRNLYSLIESMLVGDKWSKIDHVVTVSDCSRRDILTHLHVPAHRLTVVHNGIDLERFTPGTGQGRAEGRRPFVLTVAGGDRTKNVEMLVEAFGRLPLTIREGHDLMLVGDFRRRPELRVRTVQLGLEKQTLFPGVVDDDRLIELYREAAAFVFPSRYEGFGLPVLEAMACGCPVISSNASSLPEVAGDAALLVEPSDTEGAARALARVLSDPELARDLRARGPARAAQFSWDRTAKEMIAVYKKVIEGICAS